MQATVKLDKLTRAQLQNLAKQHGIAANKKSTFIRNELKKKGVFPNTEDCRVTDASCHANEEEKDEVVTHKAGDDDEEENHEVATHKRGRASDNSVFPVDKHARSVKSPPCAKQG